MLVVELAVVALAAVAAVRAVRERGHTRAALERAALADRRYRAWSGERARAMAARNTLSDVAQASGEAARRVQRGSSVVAGALGSFGGRVADSVRRLAASTPELSRGNVVKGTVVSSAEEKDWFQLMLEAAEAEDAARAEGRAEIPSLPSGGDDQPWEDAEDAWDDPADLDTPGATRVVPEVGVDDPGQAADTEPVDLEPTAFLDLPAPSHEPEREPGPEETRPVDVTWLDEAPRDD